MTMISYNENRIARERETHTKIGKTEKTNYNLTQQTPLNNLR